MHKPVTITIIASSLCGLALFSLGRAQNSAYTPTYYTDVQPILAKNCVSCHVAGGIGPFPLDNPTEAVKWADRIAEVTKSEYMPPWPPSRDSQVFFNERRLSNVSKKILEDWAKAKAPLGNAPKK
jgi:mono/diheme cytochrome c family protein